MPLMSLYLALPWLWAVLIVPWWVSLVGLILLPIAAVMIVVAVFPTPPASRRATDDIQLSDAQIERMREASSGLHNLLERWSTLSRSTGVNLESARQQVDDVILHSEAAVLEITNSFVGVTRKTRTQMEYALSLLQQARVPGENAAQKDEDCLYRSTSAHRKRCSNRSPRACCIFPRLRSNWCNGRSACESRRAASTTFSIR